MKLRVISMSALVLCLPETCVGFVAVPPLGKRLPTGHMIRPSQQRAAAVSMSQGGEYTTATDRRRFVSSAAAAIVAGSVGLGVGVGSAGAAGGDAGQLGDLESGPMEPMKVTEGAPLSDDAARIQQKLAAQAKATGRSSSGSLTFSESMAAEGKKQARMKEERNDMARRRAAMCEELGRGC